MRSLYTPVFPATAFDMVVMGASWGGIEALGQILAGLPADFPAAVAVVQHLSPHYPSRLPELLGKRTPLDVRFAQDREAILPNTIYLAPPDQHLLTQPDYTFALSGGTKMWHTRPAADPLFVSAATLFGPRTLAVVLTGCLGDGSGGIQRVKALGGRVLVQDPATAEVGEMPHAAIDTWAIDFVLPLDVIAAALISLVMIPGAASLFHVPNPHAAPNLAPYQTRTPLSYRSPRRD